ncbi:post-GPI attachment to proteins factor 3-like protein [Carex littledalei]|uniref:Post-GPI attachment to proteins factor 3 n=1 Tax=Carex littledalei TaxID=544730 RepID=A0A833VE32_9POAL|nr:post-GPI attachment to proteins factor 3-like protein [Carex littledalei]
MGRTLALFLLLTALGLVLIGAVHATQGDADPLYIECIDQCEKTGALKESSVKHCKASSDSFPSDEPWYKQEPLYVQWKEWNCKSECRYQCMMQREKERGELGLEPVKYHGKWLFKRASVFQEPLSAILSALTLLMQFNGWLSFFLLVHYKLPLRPETRKTYYEFTGLWHIYGIFSMNAWFWSSIYHSRYADWTEKSYYSSAVALLGFSLIVTIIRAFNVRVEASRVMVAAPLLAFLTTHILYLNFYQLDYSLNMKVCIAMGTAQLLIWAIWGSITRHPSSAKLWMITIGGIIAIILEIYDFPPYMGYADAHAFCLLLAIPLSYLWWSFVKEDAELRTSALMKKTK